MINVTPKMALKEVKKLIEKGETQDLVKHIERYGRITTGEYIRLVETSLITAKRDLLDLKKREIIKFVGSPKRGYYCFSDTVNDTV